MGHLCKRVGRLERRDHIAEVHLGGQPCDVVLAIGLVNLLAKILQAHALILTVDLAKIRQDAPHRLIAIVIVLELLQRREQRVPAALGDADREHDEKGIETGLFDHHAVLGQELRHQCGGNAGLAKAARHVQARRDDRRLDGVEHVEIGREVAEPVPVAIGFEHPVILGANPRAHEPLGAPDLEPPIAVAIFKIDLAHRAAKVERLADAFLDKRRAPRGLHHRCGHVARRDDRVLRRSRRVHQVGLVENVAVKLARLGLLHDDLRCLRDAGKQLVGGVRREHHRLGTAGAIRPDRVHVTVKLVKRRVRQPGFVEMQRVDHVAELGLDHLDVIDHPVVRALRERQDPWLLVLDRPRERVGLDLAHDVFGLEFGERNRPDDAQVISRRPQEHRNRSGHGDRVQDRLVTIAIDHHDVVGGHVGVPDDLVGGRRAIRDEITVVGVEDARRVEFGFGDRTSMVKQLPEFVHRVADIRAQHVFAEELVKHLPDRAFEERHPAGVPRAMPGVGAILCVLDQLAEKRRGQAVDVAAGLADDVARHEFRRVLEHVNETVQFAQDVVRDVL